ncbi:cupin domain-containing protein [Staphylococcus rostri]|uniref:Cupin type-2 domain-containing protein n=1 Tax=Staphylococcus rostri TaxID=522262 RepID=A0A2K3YU05_9STAP|nr:cupin domain-containing protein [Staphylococcus rostri]PNZ29055.1 hypothetical protein CD122_02685 [Staphylococcus rostri]
MYVHNSYVETHKSHSKTGVFPAHSTGVKEYIYILKGHVTIELTENRNQQRYHLQAGDSFYFEAHKDHQFINDADELCEYMLVIDSNKSINRH